MTISELIPVLNYHIEQQSNFLIYGAPGLGKTDLHFQVCQKLNIPLIVMTPALDDPTRYSGLYFVTNGQAQVLPFVDLKKVLETENRIHVFFDDLGQGSYAVQKALMPWLHGETIQGYRIPREKLSFSAATNRKIDKSGVEGILEPVKSRFYFTYQLDFHLASWVQYGINKGYPDILLAFAKFQQDLFEFRPNLDLGVSINPRTYSHLCEKFDSFPQAIRSNLILGNLGLEQGTNFLNFEKCLSSLPNLNDIIKGKFVSPDLEASILYVVIMSLVKKFDLVNCDNICKWISSLPVEFQGLFISLAQGGTKKELIESTAFFTSWKIKNQSIEKF